MVDAIDLVRLLKRNDVGFFAGVPDSLLAGLISALPAPGDTSKHVVAANEGNAVALGAGYHLATGRLAGIYFQNSGLGNALNPLLSLCDPAVHGIPLLLLIGWRGQPGQLDELQHAAQGRATLPLLEAACIPYRVLRAAEADAADDVGKMVAVALSGSRPSAIVVPKGSLRSASSELAAVALHGLTRKDAIVQLDTWCQDVQAAGFSTTGHISREIIELCGSAVPPFRYFLNFGAMGHVSQIALAFALSQPERLVLCVDGDGSALMHLGGMASLGQLAPANLTHVILDNRAHSSVGGFATCATVDFSSVGNALGYRRVFKVVDGRGLIAALDACKKSPREGPTLINVRTQVDSGVGLPRPQFDAIENKIAFTLAQRSPATCSPREMPLIEGG